MDTKNDTDDDDYGGEFQGISPFHKLDLACLDVPKRFSSRLLLLLLSSRDPFSFGTDKDGRKERCELNTL